MALAYNGTWIVEKLSEWKLREEMAKVKGDKGAR